MILTLVSKDFVNVLNTDSLVFRIDNSIKELESHMEVFKLAHREYVERILEDDSGDEED